MIRIQISSGAGTQRFEHARGPLEFGRGPDRELPRRIVEDASLSDDQLRVEQVGPARIRLENLSPTIGVHLGDGSLIKPGDARECDLPARITIGGTLIEVDPGRTTPDDLDRGRASSGTRNGPTDFAQATLAGRETTVEDQGLSPSFATIAGLDTVPPRAEAWTGAGTIGDSAPGTSPAIPGQVEDEAPRVSEPGPPDDTFHATTLPDSVTGSDPYATRVEGPSPGAAPEADATGSDGPRFRVLRAHARGGLGEVFVAHDEEVCREVALKEIQVRYADRPESRARFLLEAEITGGLEHPGIVPVYGLGRYPDGRPYYAMRFIRGDSLKEAIERFHAAERPGRDPGERALQLRGLLRRFVDVCNAMSYAHGRCVIHRDLKPGNIMLGPYGETLVVDWGLAKPIGSPETAPRADDLGQSPLLPSNSSATVMGAAVGTPQFMSPEQAEGQLERILPASDIYSLGATLYCLLTGQPPFLATDVATVLEQVRRGEFPAPRRVHPGVDAALEAICLKAMRLRPEDRYPSARALADDLEHWLADEPVTAWREPLPRRVLRWARRHRTLVTASAAATLVALLAGGSFLYDAQLRAAKRLTAAVGRVQALESAEVRAIPSIIDELGEDRHLVRDLLIALARGDGSGKDDRRRMPAALALLADDPSQAKVLADWLLNPESTPDELLVIREALDARALAARVAPRLRQAVSARGPELSDEQLRAAGALAGMARNDPLWKDLSGPVARKLVRENPLRIRAWREVFEPLSTSLRAPLGEVYADRDRPEARALAYTLLFAFATRPENPDRVEDLSALIGDADKAQFLEVLGRLDTAASRERAIASLAPRVARPATFDDVLARRQGRWALALLKLGRPDVVWPLFRRRDDPALRTELIQNFARFDFPAGLVIARLEDESDVSARRALILCLGEFPPAAIDPAVREDLIARWLIRYREDPDPGVHGAVNWLLRRPGWDRAADLVAIDRGLASSGPVAGRDWFVNGQGQTFTRIRGPLEFLMGSTETSDPNRQLDEARHARRIGRSFAIATRELTLAEYGAFLDGKPAGVTDWRDNPQFRKDFPSPDCAIGAVTWYDAARYCNWLSAREGLPEDQWCYPNRIAPGMSLPEDSLSRTGYRLPTEAEWEYACRAGSQSARPYGRAKDWLGEYEWYKDNAGGRMHPVAGKKPNDLGLFDLLGNALEWCSDPYRKYPGEGPVDDILVKAAYSDQQKRVLRGGTFNVTAYDPRSAIRYSFPPSFQQTLIGFRVGFTCP